MPDRKSTQERAYEAYGAVTNFRNFQGNPMPAWADLPPIIRDAWAAAAAAVTPVSIPDGLDSNPNAIHGYTDGCPHCPDGHRPATSGPWHARVSDALDSDGQPLTIVVARPAGQHVADTDAEWIRQRLNSPAE